MWSVWNKKTRQLYYFYFYIFIIMRKPWRDMQNATLYKGVFIRVSQAKLCTLRKDRGYIFVEDGKCVESELKFSFAEKIAATDVVDFKCRFHERGWGLLFIRNRSLPSFFFSHSCLLSSNGGF